MYKYLIVGIIIGWIIGMNNGVLAAPLPAAPAAPVAPAGRAGHVGPAARATPFALPTSTARATPVGPAARAAHVAAIAPATRAAPTAPTAAVATAASAAPAAPAAPARQYAYGTVCECPPQRPSYTTYPYLSPKHFEPTFSHLTNKMIYAAPRIVNYRFTSPRFTDYRPKYYGFPVTHEAPEKYSPFDTLAALLAAERKHRKW